MRIDSCLLVLLLAAPLAVCASSSDTGVRCRADLDDIAAFLPLNDAGAPEARALHGKRIDTALSRAQADSARLQDAAGDSACDAILAAYLQAWRPGHLSVGALAPDAAAPVVAAPDPRLPHLESLGPDTLLLTIPSFNDRYRAPLETLLARRRAELEAHRYWIIDVRGNGGGSDTTYAALLPWLLDGDYRQHALEYLATPVNIRAQEQICARQSDPAPCLRQMAPAVAAMRAATPGSFVTSGDERGTLQRPARLEPKAPRRVAVLVDRECGSSCDQFALTVKAGFRVKLAGQASAGVVDVGNLRPHTLPSGRVLRYATTRSTRVAELPLDGIGVQPDLLLPAPADDAAREADVLRVQRWLESGRL